MKRKLFIGSRCVVGVEAGVGHCRAPVWTLLWWEAGYGEQDLWEGCCLTLMGWRTSSELSTPLYLPSHSHSRVTIPMCWETACCMLYRMDHSSQGAGQSFLFIFRCWKESMSPFAAADLHSYLMLLVSLDFSLVFPLEAAETRFIERLRTALSVKVCQSVCSEFI